MTHPTLLRPDVLCLVNDNTTNKNKKISRLSLSLPFFLATTTTAFPKDTTSYLTFLSIFASSILGMLADRQPFFQGSGILITLVVSAIASNNSLIPNNHPLYDMAWSTFLPSSLALLLLATTTTSSSRTQFSQHQFVKNETRTHNTIIMDSIARVGIAFLVGSLGSILGCATSFWLLRDHRQPLHPQLRHGTTVRTLWTLPPRQAALAAGCLCASYIGGSVNFFATARILTSHAADSRQRHDATTTSSSSSLLGAMATADLLVMAIYFTIMASAIQFRPLQRIFTSERDNREQSSFNNDGMMLEAAPTDETICMTDDMKQPLTNSARQGIAMMLVSSLAFAIVKVSNQVEAIFSVIPGTACAAIALLAPLLATLLQSLGNATSSSASLRLWKEMQQNARWLSEFSFHILFAAIGASVNLGNVLRTGPACLLFSLLALLVHVVVIVAGSRGLQRLAIPRLPRLSWSDVLIASNAAIGGPTTAAAFAGRVQLHQQGTTVNVDGSSTLGLTIAATFWGVVGYAIGTVIGTKLSLVLLRTT